MDLRSCSRLKGSLLTKVDSSNVVVRSVGFGIGAKNEKQLVNPVTLALLWLNQRRTEKLTICGEPQVIWNVEIVWVLVHFS